MLILRNKINLKNLIRFKILLSVSNKNSNNSSIMNLMNSKSGPWEINSQINLRVEMYSLQGEISNKKKILRMRRIISDHF
jgi:hypothetical protein